MPTDKSLVGRLPPDIQQILTKEITDFFHTMATAKRGWRDIPMQSVLEATADALIEVGKRKGHGTAYLETLLLEMQDKLNRE